MGRARGLCISYNRCEFILEPVCLSCRTLKGLTPACHRLQHSHLERERQAALPMFLQPDMLCTCPAGFVAFVLKLEKGYYLVQFRQYAWVHLILLFVFMPSSFFVSNIFDGIIWFLLPCSLVIINDIGAYLAGKLFDLFSITLLCLSLAEKPTF